MQATHAHEYHQHTQIRITLADCEAAISRGEPDTALRRLEAVPPASPHYMRARMALAGVYLRARRDRAGYIRCYLDLVVRWVSWGCWRQMGRRLMNVHRLGFLPICSGCSRRLLAHNSADTNVPFFLPGLHPGL
jgi:hypothetical protein